MAEHTKSIKGDAGESMEERFKTYWLMTILSLTFMIVCLNESGNTICLHALYRGWASTLEYTCLAAKNKPFQALSQAS